MKTRLGFVSNSSSSSFVCDVCGESYTEWDATYEDMNMSHCEHDHSWCQSHINYNIDDKLTKKKVLELLDIKDYPDIIEEIKDLTEDEFKKYKLEHPYNIIWEMTYENIPEEFCPLCNMDMFTQEMLVDYLVKKTDFTKADMFAIIKEKNKRRKKLYLKEYLEYVFENKKLLETDVINEIKDKFKTYEELYQYLYGK